MIILNKPYISPFLEDTLEHSQEPVLVLKAPEELQLHKALNYLTPEEFRNQYHKNIQTPLYTNSEDSFQWIFDNLQNPPLKSHIQHFKDKHRFRELMRPFYPDYQFRKVKLEDLDNLNIDSIPKPFIIKPNVGFFSLAVYFVRNNSEWEKTVAMIKRDMLQSKDLFPEVVVSSAEFIIEDAIEGEEFAVDAYFTKEGTPVIMNIYHHYHIDASDTGDRLYYTSKSIMQTYYDQIYAILEKIHQTTQVTLFPMHLELRLDYADHFNIIEANPLRFAGFCVGDLAWYAYGINPYLYYFNQEAPDWSKILENQDSDRYAFILGDIPKEISSNQVKSVDYEKFTNKFTHPLDIRKMNFHEYPLFSIAFVKFSSTDEAEMKKIMRDRFLDVINV